MACHKKQRAGNWQVLVWAWVVESGCIRYRTMWIRYMWTCGYAISTQSFKSEYDISAIFFQQYKSLDIRYVVNQFKIYISSIKKKSTILNEKDSKLVILLLPDIPA